jgi:hypothetical protein
MTAATFESWMSRNYVHVAYQSLLVLCLVLLLRAGCGRNCPQPIIAREEKVTKADTSNKIVEHAPVRVEGTAKITPRPRKTVAVNALRFVPDSDLIASNIVSNSVPLAMVDSLEPFTASLDTTIGKDTISAAYDYPENQFRIEFKRAADTVQVINTTTEVTRYIAPDWYEKPLFVASTTTAVIVSILLLVR